MVQGVFGDVVESVRLYCEICLFGDIWMRWLPFLSFWHENDVYLKSQYRFPCSLNSWAFVFGFGPYL